MVDRPGKDWFASSREMKTFIRKERYGCREVRQENRLVTFPPNDDQQQIFPESSIMECSQSLSV